MRGVSTPRIKRQASISAENSYISKSPLWTKRGVATLHSKQYREYQLSATNISEESIKNRENFTKFEAKFEKPSDTK